MQAVDVSGLIILLVALAVFIVGVRFYRRLVLDGRAQRQARAIRAGLSRRKRAAIIAVVLACWGLLMFALYWH